jgi:hypothetical protein
VIIDVDVGKEQPTSAIKNNDMNDRQNVVLEDVDVQNQATRNMFESEKTNDQSKVQREDDEITNNLPDTYDELRLNLHKEEIGDQKDTR